MEMADYSSMYKKLFNVVTDAIEILQAAQVETERLYINHESPNITLLKLKDGNGGDDNA